VPAENADIRRQLSIRGQITHRPIPASAAGLYLGSECIVGYPEPSMPTRERCGMPGHTPRCHLLIWATLPDRACLIDELYCPSILEGLAHLEQASRQKENAE
jgi:hypothetical protein